MAGAPGALNPATLNLIQGNRIGTDVTGTAGLGNFLGGIGFDSATTKNSIGGTIAAGIDRYENNDSEVTPATSGPNRRALPRYDNAFSNSRSNPLDINDDDSDVPGFLNAVCAC